MYVNGMGFRAIERVKGVHHTTVIYWVKQLAKQLPDAPQESEIQRWESWMNSFVGSKKTRSDLDSGKPLYSRNSGMGYG